MNPTRHRAHGLTLVEVLLVIGVLIIAFGIEAQLFHSAMVATRSAPESVQQHALLDQAIGVMRLDVWNAGGIDFADPQTIDLQQADGTNITWRLTPTGAQRIGNETRTFDFKPSLAARSAPAGIALMDTRHPDDAIHLTSQLMLIKGSK